MKLFKRIATLLTALLLLASVGAVAACTTEEGGDEKVDPVEKTETVTVTFDLNYSGSTNTTEQVDKGAKVTKPEDPARDGYDFDNWYVDQELSAAFDFNTAINEDTTIYANWYEAGVTYHTLTLDLNYTGSTSTTRKVKDQERLQTLADPERDGYDFVAWYTDAACTQKFSYTTRITEDVTLYARWATLYVFEAEHTYLRDKIGPSSSGTGSYLGMLYPDTKNLGASNGYAVTYLYANDGDNGGQYKTTLTFYIDSDVAVTDAKLYLRITAELASITLNGTEYQVIVNGTAYNYDDVTLDIVDSNTPGNFRDVLVSSSVKLNEGMNTIQLKVSNNEKAIGGTTTAKAPVVDCIKISTDANLGWTSQTVDGVEYPVLNDELKESLT